MLAVPFRCPAIKPAPSTTELPQQTHLHYTSTMPANNQLLICTTLILFAMLAMAAPRPVPQSGASATTDSDDLGLDGLLSTVIGLLNSLLGALQLQGGEIASG